jgi:hypothetical protein
MVAVQCATRMHSFPFLLICSFPSRKMESTLTLSRRRGQSLLQHFLSTVIWQFQVVDARHNARQIIVAGVRWLTWLADHGKHGRQTLESTNGQLGTASHELQEVATSFWRKLGHSLEQVPDALAVHVKSMIRFDRVHQCFDGPIFLNTTEKHDQLFGSKCL